MQRVYQRPRASFLADFNYRQGYSGLIDPDAMNIGGGYGNPQFLDFRLIVFHTAGRHTPPSTTPYHRAGYFPIYATPGNGLGWYAWGAHRYEQTGSAVDPWPRSGSNTPIAHWVIALKNVDPVQPVYPAGHPFAPSVTTANNTLSWGVPGFTDLHDEHLLLHINICFFGNKNCYYVTMPDNVGMSRNYNYWPDAGSYGFPPSGQPPENAITSGYALNIDYAYVGGSETSTPARSKAFGGPNIPSYCSTFQVLIRGKSASGGFFVASNLMGGATPL